MFPVAVQGRAHPTCCRAIPVQIEQLGSPFGYELANKAYPLAVRRQPDSARDRLNCAGNPLLQMELDVHAFEAVILRRPLPQNKPPIGPCMDARLSMDAPIRLSTPPPMDAVKRCSQDVRRLNTTDACPVLSRLAYSQIGDQLFVPSDWEKRAGSCDPRQKRTLPRPAKTIGYLLRLGLAVLGEKVVYRGGRDKIMAEGWIAANGILCARCGYVVGCTEFEKCAGMRMRKPGKHIHFADGCSLLDYTLRMRANFFYS